MKSSKLQYILKRMMIIFILLVIVLEGLIIYIGKIDNSNESDYLIILGAGLYGDKLSPILESRMYKSLEYIEQYPDVKIIVSGGQGANEMMSEAQAMYNFLVSHGVNGDNIIMENQSTSTAENIQFSKEIIENMNYKKDATPQVTVITNNFHMLRAKMLCEFNDLEAYGKPSISSEPSDKFYFVREIPAFVKTIIFDMLFKIQ